MAKSKIMLPNYETCMSNEVVDLNWMAWWRKKKSELPSFKRNQ